MGFVVRSPAWSFLALFAGAILLSACAPKFNFTPGSSSVSGGSSYTGGSGSSGPVQIFRSVGPGNTSVLACGGSDGSGCSSDAGNLTISGTTASFTSSLPANIGVGDAIVYDSNSNGSLGAGDSVAFISGRTSSTQYSVQSASGGTPTTYGPAGVWRIYRAYTSLANALTGYHSENSAIVAINSTLGYFDSGFDSNNNLVTGNLQWMIACYADGTDTTSADTAGWTTGATNYLKIYTPYLSTDVGTSQRHDGAWSSGGYELAAASADFDLNVAVNSIDVEGLRLGGSPTYCPICFDDHHTGIVGAGATSIDSNLIEVQPGSSSSVGISIASATTNLTGNVDVYNNIVFMASGIPTEPAAAIEDGLSDAAPSYGANIYAYDNTIVGAFGSGFLINGTGNNLVLKNNIVQGATVDAYYTGGGGSYGSGSDYNIANDGTTTGGAHDIKNATIAFANMPMNDYRLSPTDTVAMNAGEDLSTDPNLSFDTDIADLSRNQSANWDIGASEAVPSSANATQLLALTLQGADASFVATALFSGDHNDNGSAEIYYCDATASPGCSALAGSSAAMTRASGSFTYTATGLTNGDTYNVLLVAADSDGVSGNDMSGTVIVQTPQIYVADSGNNRIEVFTLGGVYSSQYGSSEFLEPIGPTFDASGNMWTADTDNDRIVEYNPSETLVTSFGSTGSGNGEFENPQVLAINADGDFYVVDQDNYRVEVFNSSQNYLFQFGSYGSGDGQFKHSQGIAIGPTGNVYVADETNNNIQIFSPTGAYLGQFGTPGSGNGEFENLQAITIDSSGNIYAADNSNCRIEKFDANGNYLSQFGGCGSGNGEFNSLIGVAVDASGNIYTSDYGNDDIQIFNSSGTYQSTFGAYGSGNGQFNSPQYVVVH